MFPTANGECSTSSRQKVRFALLGKALLGKAFKYYVQCFLVKCFSGVLRVQTKFGLSVSHQDFVEHGGRVISAAKRPETLHVPLVATKDLLSESPNSIFGTSFFLRETMNSLPGTNKLAFTESGMRLFSYLIKTKPHTSYTRVIS